MKLLKRIRPSIAARQMPDGLVALPELAKSVGVGTGDDIGELGADVTVVGQGAARPHLQEDEVRVGIVRHTDPAHVHAGADPARPRSEDR